MDIEQAAASSAAGRKDAEATFASKPPSVMNGSTVPVSPAKCPIRKSASRDDVQRHYHETALQIAREYNVMIGDLARLTAQLPGRFGFDGETTSPSKSKPTWIDRRGLQTMTDIDIGSIDLDSAAVLEYASRSPRSLGVEGKLVGMDEEAETDQLEIYVNLFDGEEAEVNGEGYIDPKETSLEKRFSLKDDWGKTTSVEDNSHLEMAQMSMSKSQSAVLDADDTYLLTESVSGVLRCLLGPPTDPKRVVWELLGTTLVVYDMIAIPLVAAFTPPDNLFTTSMDWIALIYWTLNVPVVLTTGFISKGVLILNPHMILKQYAKTWLVVDAVTLCPDWFFTIMGLFNNQDKKASSYMKLLRVLRLLRLARLLRLLKLRHAWHMLLDALDSEAAGILLDVLKMVVVLGLVNHYVACFWFLVGLAQGSRSWMEAHGFTGADVDWGDQYVVSYHWSITQFTPSSMHVQPQTVNERVFAIFTLIFALVGFSYLVGSITGNLTRLRAMGERKANLFWHLRKFLTKTGVPAELSLRIKSYVETRWQHQENHMKPSSVTLLDLLSEHLKGELASALHGPSLCIHPLFHHLDVQVSLTVQRLCLTGLSELSLAPHDVMFVAGEEATHMTFVTVGILEYSRMFSEQCYDEIVMSGEDWIAEPVLWVKGWHYLGDLRAKVSTELLRVSPERVIEIVNLNPVAYKMVSFYARGYSDWLNEMDKDKLSDISQGEDVSDQLESLLDSTLEQSQSAREGGGMWETPPSAPAPRAAINKLYQRANLIRTTAIGGGLVDGDHGDSS